jgi:hypothetical protein
MLGGDELVRHGARLVLGGAQDGHQVGVGRGLGHGRQRRQLGEPCLDVSVDRRADAVEDPAHERVLGLQQRGEQVDRRDLRVLALRGERDRGLDRRACHLGESV